MEFSRREEEEENSNNNNTTRTNNIVSIDHIVHDTCDSYAFLCDRPHFLCVSVSSITTTQQQKRTHNKNIFYFDCVYEFSEKEKKRERD